MLPIYFSIIIPVYNVEKYLNQCVDSVLVQSFGNFEVILIDDGSVDGSPQICDDYAAKDPRVRVIHKENGGASDARNCGVREAGGKYLMFLDSDDYWDDADALRKIYELITENGETADVVMFQAKLLYPDGTMIPDCYQYAENLHELAPVDALVSISKNGGLIGSACSKVVRRVFLIENDLFFKVGIKCEDIHWIIRLANSLPVYQYTDQYFYIYRKGRTESVTGSMDSVHLNQFAGILEEFSNTYVYANETVRECLLSLIAYELSILMASSANMSGSEEKKKLIRRIKQMQWVLNYDMHPKVRGINWIRKLVGFELTMVLLGIYLKYRKR